VAGDTTSRRVGGYLYNPGCLAGIYQLAYSHYSRLHDLPHMEGALSCRSCLQYQQAKQISNSESRPKPVRHRKDFLNNYT
jgi:hypothetical protein